MPPVPLFIFGLIQLSVVSYYDVKYRKISNAWPALNIAVYLFALILFKGEYTYALETFVFTGLFLVVGIVLFALKIMGGGDSKFLASIFLIIPLKGQDEFFTYLLILTIVVGGALFLSNIFANIGVLWKAFQNGALNQVKSVFGKKFPFSPVILGAWICLGVQHYLLS